MVSPGPLAVRFGAPPPLDLQAGTLVHAPLELENAGSLQWVDGVLASYHWLDDRDNPIVWDGMRTPLPQLRPGERTTAELAVRAPIPPGRYRLAFDLVAEQRAWFSELGSAPLALDVVVRPRVQEPNAVLPPNVEPAPDWAQRARPRTSRAPAACPGSRRR